MDQHPHPDRAPTPQPLEDEPDDVVGHRFLTAEQAQERAERAREQRDREPAADGVESPG